MLKKEITLTTFLIVYSSSLLYAGKTVHKTLDPDFNYSEGEFKYTHNDKFLYTEPQKPQNINTSQSVKIYNGHPEEMPYEKLLMRVKSGKDGRTRVLDTTQWPYLFHSQLGLHFSDGKYGGSGVMVGPHHLLTCAHNVYNFDKREWVSNIIARLSLNDNTAPFGEVKATNIYTFQEWIDKKDPCFDLALITLNQSIGYQTGWSGLLCSENSELLKKEVNITGYPGDKGCKQMWSMSHSIKKIESERLFYDIDTNKGQSGSGIWIKKLGEPYTIGIHTSGEEITFTGNSGVRLSKEKLHQIITEWISKTLNIQQTIQKPIRDKNSEPLNRRMIEDKSIGGDVVDDIVDPDLLKDKEESLKFLAEGVGFVFPNIKDEAKIAKRILKKISDKGESISSMAKALDVSSSTVSKLMNGDSESPKTVDAMKLLLKKEKSLFYKMAEKSSIKNINNTKLKVKKKNISNPTSKEPKKEKNLASIANKAGLGLRNFKDDNTTAKSILKKISDKGESISSMAKALDISSSTVSKFMNGDSKSPKTVDAITLSLKKQNSSFYKKAKKIKKK